MDKAQQPQDDFGAFLESVNRSGKREEKNGSSSHASFRIVRYLAQTHEARVESIMTHVRTPFSEFTSGLQELSEAGLIKMEEGEDGSIIELTDEGQIWAQTMLTLETDDDEKPKEERD